MTAFKFIKMCNLGNDFVIIDAREEIISVNAQQAKHIADRKFGIGCDQLIIIRKSKISDCKLEMFNADGSIADACGNATICIASMLGGSGQIEIGSRLVDFNEYGVNMGQALFEWNQIPLSKQMDTMNVTISGITGSCVNVGNPHMVFFDIDILKDATCNMIEHHEFFPKKININFAHIIDRSNIRLCTWERGVGFTLSCGTGAIATASIALKKGLIENDCNIHFEYGHLKVSIKDDNLILNGTPLKIFKGSWL